MFFSACFSSPHTDLSLQFHHPTTLMSRSLQGSPLKHFPSHGWLFIPSRHAATLFCLRTVLTTSVEWEFLKIDELANFSIWKMTRFWNLWKRMDSLKYSLQILISLFMVAVKSSAFRKHRPIEEVCYSLPQLQHSSMFLYRNVAKRTSWRHAQRQPRGKLLLISFWKGAVSRKRGDSGGAQEPVLESLAIPRD